MGDWIALIVLALVVLAPLGWGLWKDRREERALAVRADIQSAVDHTLHGQSMISVWVTAGSLGRVGRVEVSVPAGWEPLLAEVWPAVLARVPRGYELVIQPSSRPDREHGAKPDTLRRAA
ncbi:MAG TPA: hypothetical protein VFO18_01340 [Methylomirabilota bacterium]|nr:hypothetical protein [Methylomirabilota bacterium]